jgi:antitoxin MazE
MFIHNPKEGTVQTTITKWGNSLALRIPAAIIKDLGIFEGVEVQLTIEGGRLIIERPRYTLEELLSGITPENIHSEITTGDPVGHEEW